MVSSRDLVLSTNDSDSEDEFFLDPPLRLFFLVRFKIRSNSESVLLDEVEESLLKFDLTTLLVVDAASKGEETAWLLPTAGSRPSRIAGDWTLVSLSVTDVILIPFVDDSDAVLLLVRARAERWLFLLRAAEADEVESVELIRLLFLCLKLDKAEEGEVGFSAEPEGDGTGFDDDPTSSLPKRWNKLFHAQSNILKSHIYEMPWLPIQCWSRFFLK